MTITTSRIGSIRPADKKPREGDPLNKNLWFVSSKEARSTYVFLVILLHFILLSMPFLNTSQAWTLTNLVHAVVSTSLKKRFFSCCRVAKNSHFWSKWNDKISRFSVKK